MSARPTPGPWTSERQDELSGEIYWAIHAASDYRFVANVYSNAEHARLIAAAPTMFDYIKLMAANGDPDAVEIMATINAGR